MSLPPLIDPHRHAVFVDFDGTLVELVDDPQAVAIAPAALERLEALQAALGGALAVVSGRRIADLDRFLAPMRFAAAGVHGLERRVRPDGATERLAGPEVLDDVREKLGGPLRDNPRLKLEDKGTALVLHYRTAPDLKAVAERAMAEATAGRHDLNVMNGDNIVEVHPTGMDKGKALAAMMRDAPFAGRVPVYVGDDTTDEFALKHVRDAGGVSVKVGDKRSVAEFRLAGVAAVHRWLAASA
ncbi:trehalose-phosphatase [Aurantimonas marianensis]|uniref:Trehalose 6-phosphate phosphatase n=1 Tax=Aurantimonas marianensis TaxID=2920428 RepID=A0A9X2KFR1_9HYPH|nr:trehalose-phosphatase [Aurantimonas marianensis]MCP3056064.1 trehalose-phosphatase [Aurantimonas marianensis]